MLYQLSYASRLRSSWKKSNVKIDSALGTVKTPGHRPFTTPREHRTTSEKAARRSEPESTLWLPLPERTGGDREEPHCPPGFVDRAYLVFLQNELRTTTQQDTDQVEVALTPFSFGLIVEAHLPNQGTSPVQRPHSAAGSSVQPTSPDCLSHRIRAFCNAERVPPSESGHILTDLSYKNVLVQ